MLQEMIYEYEYLKDELLSTWQGMSESRFNYQLGQLNTLAGWTGMLQDYVDNVLGAIETELMS